jgi:hemerythrin
MPAEWKSNRRTGIIRLDDINRNFLRTINNFIKDCQQGVSRQKLPEFFKYMEKYISEQLPVEEKYMKEYGYLNMISHTSMHSLFKRSFSDLKRQYEKEGESSKVLIAAVHLLTSWIVSHLNRSDIELAEYLRSMTISKNF